MTPRYARPKLPFCVVTRTEAQTQDLYRPKGSCFHAFPKLSLNSGRLSRILSALLSLNVVYHKKKMIFRFIDPIWAWIMGASEMDPADILWEPRTQIDNNGTRLYGGGVQYGECFASAYRSCPAGTYPMGISLHWDGTNAHGVYSVPIAIGVANTNRETANSHTCIAYMPVLTGMGREFDASTKAAHVRHYIRQTCIAAVLSVLEGAARHGVRCTLSIDGL